MSTGPESHGGTCHTTSPRGRPSTDTSPPGRRTASSSSSTVSCDGLSRKAEGRDAEPSARILDAQSIKTSANGPAAGQGIDAGKKTAGRKRHVGVDPPHLLLAVLVTAASASDNAGGIHLPSNIAEGHPCVTKAWADSGYRTKAIDHGPRLGVDVEVARREPTQKGFEVIPSRWVVEPTFGCLMHHHRLARDYETHPHRSEAMINIAVIDLMSRRLSHESTPNWRDSCVRRQSPERDSASRPSRWRSPGCR